MKGQQMSPIQGQGRFNNNFSQKNDDVEFGRTPKALTKSSKPRFSGAQLAALSEGNKDSFTKSNTAIRFGYEDYGDDYGYDE